MIATESTPLKESTWIPPSSAVKTNSHPDVNPLCSENCHDKNYQHNQTCQQTIKNASEFETQTMDKKSVSFLSFSRSTKIVVIFYSITNFLSGCAFSLLGPFFPQEAQKKGVSLFMSGIVFSVFQLVIFLTSPIFGTYMTRIGAKFVFLSGIFLAGSSSILFGTLSHCPPGGVFIVMSILTRSVMALGSAAYTTASVAMVTLQCDKAMGTAFAILGSATGAGFMMGPAIGGVLFSFGGFSLPFYVMGSIILINGAVISRFIPSLSVEEKSQRKSIFKLLRSPLILVSISCIFLAALGISAYDATFSIHLMKFNLQTIYISLMFMATTGMYSLCTPLWGYITDNKSLHQELIVMGLLLYCVGWLMAGPSSLLPFLPHKIWVVTIGVLVIGLSEGCVVIPAMHCCVLGSKELKFDAGLDTYSLVSGLITSTISLGGVTGPLLGGSIVEKWGYPIGYTIVAGIALILCGVALILFLYRRKRGNKDGKFEDTSCHIRQ